MTFLFISQEILDKSIHERLRVEVDGGGCSGFEYKIKLDTQLNEDDLLWTNKQGVEIVVDKVIFIIYFYPS